MITGKYPTLRLRRNRKADWVRRLVEESNLSSNDLILPIFLISGKNRIQSIKTMPGVFRYSIDQLSKILDKAIFLRIPMVALFPYSHSKVKNKHGSEALNEEAVSVVKKGLPVPAPNITTLFFSKCLIAFLLMYGSAIWETLIADWTLVGTDIFSSAFCRESAFINVASIPI